MRRLRTAFLLFIILMCSGCAKNATNMSSSAQSKAMPGIAGEQSNSSEFRPDRMLVWRANVGIEVGDVNQAIGKASIIAEQSGGYIESKSESADNSAQVRLRVHPQNLWV